MSAAERRGRRLLHECGAKPHSPRDHFTEQPAPWVAAVCDRGVRHSRNEDAVALDAGPEPGSHAVLVVCDGVSSSTDSDVASLAAARAARDVLAAPTPGIGTAAHAGRGESRALVAAADAANEAVIAHTAPGPGNPASCTFVAAVVDGPLVVVGLGRRQPGLLAPRRGAPELLTTDDSFAAEQIARATPRAEAESGPQAHAITRWLGVDAPDHTPRTVSVDLDGPGWVLVCSDGLWNYCSEPRTWPTLVRRRGRTRRPIPSGWPARSSTGPTSRAAQDNITVALARVEPVERPHRPTASHAVRTARGTPRGSHPDGQRSQLTSTRTSSCPRAGPTSTPSSP